MMAAENWVTATEVSEMLADHGHTHKRATIIRWATSHPRQRGIPAPVKLGVRRVWFDADQILAWIDGLPAPERPAERIYQPDTRPPSMKAQEREKNIVHRLATRQPVDFGPEQNESMTSMLRGGREARRITNPAAIGAAIVPSSTLRRATSPASRFGDKVGAPVQVSAGMLCSSAPALEAQENRAEVERQAVSDHSRTLRWTPRG